MSKCKKRELNTNIWTNTNVERYLKLFSKCPVLWDETRCDFYNSKCKSVAYGKFANELKLRNVDARECRKVFQSLKKIYAHRHRRPDDVKPVWFDVMGKILRDAARTKGKDKCLCGKYGKTCHKHCAKENLDHPCDYYREIEKCNECCNKNNSSGDDDKNKMLCCADTFTTPETLALQNRYDMCEDCCARQGICAPCADFYASESSDGSNVDPCDKYKIGLKDVVGCKIEYITVAVVIFDEDTDDESVNELIICECSSDGGSSSTDSIEKFCNEG